MPYQSLTILYPPSLRRKINHAVPTGIYLQALHMMNSRSRSNWTMAGAKAVFVVDLGWACDYPELQHGHQFPGNCTFTWKNTRSSSGRKAFRKMRWFFKVETHSEWYMGGELEMGSSKVICSCQKKCNFAELAYLLLRPSSTIVINEGNLRQACQYL